MNPDTPFLKMVRRMGNYGGPWEEHCPDEGRWYFTRDGKHSITYATVNWESQTILFDRRWRTW
jgi:hypothetical protein